MSTKCLSWGIDQVTGSPTRKVVLLLLCDLADEQFTCYPGREYLAEHAELSPSTISAALTQLQRDGFVRVLRRARRRGGRSTNRYLVCVNGVNTPLPDVDDWVGEFVPVDLESAGQGNSPDDGPFDDDIDETAGQSNSPADALLPVEGNGRVAGHSTVADDDVSNKEEIYPLGVTQEQPPPPPTFTPPALGALSAAATTRLVARNVLRQATADVDPARLPTTLERERLVDRVVELFEVGGWTYQPLVDRLVGMGGLATVASVYAVLTSRLRNVGHPAPVATTERPMPRVLPRWCGSALCDPISRRQVDDEMRPRFALDGDRHVPLYCEDCSGR